MRALSSQIEVLDISAKAAVAKISRNLTGDLGACKIGAFD
jgi:hypothetical protein